MHHLLETYLKEQIWICFMIGIYHSCVCKNTLCIRIPVILKHILWLPMSGKWQKHIYPARILWAKSGNILTFRMNHLLHILIRTILSFNSCIFPKTFFFVVVVRFYWFQSGSFKCQAKTIHTHTPIDLSFCCYLHETAYFEHL